MYTFINEPQMEFKESSKEKKEAMQIAYNSEIIKQKDTQIERLIIQQNKRTPILIHSTFWTAISFIIALAFIFTFGYFYRLEFQKQYKEKYQLLKTSLEKEVGLLRAQNVVLSKMTSDIELNSKNLSESLKMQNKELLERNQTLTAELSKTQDNYKIVLENTNALHAKYGGKLEQLELEILNLRNKMGKN